MEPLSKKASKLLSTTEGAKKMNDAVDAERRRYEKKMKGEKINESETEGFHVERIGFGQKQED